MALECGPGGCEVEDVPLLQTKGGKGGKGGNAAPCQELQAILDLFDETYDDLWYAAPEHGVNLVGCPNRTTANPFFPSVAVLIYDMLESPGDCVIGFCDEETALFKSKKQDCGTTVNYQHPWFGGPAAEDQLDWDKMICEADTDYLSRFLPTAPECALASLTSIGAIKKCLVAAEKGGDLGYCAMAVERPELHKYYEAETYILWHRTAENTGKPPSKAAVMGFSFGKGADCDTVEECHSANEGESGAGKTNDILGTAAVAYQQHAGDVKLVLQYEVAVAAKARLEELNEGDSFTWAPFSDKVMRLMQGEKELDVYALGGLHKGEYLNTMQVYEIGSDIAGGGPVIALAHPSHLPRVYRAMKAGAAEMSNVFMPISPYGLKWYEGDADYNIFSIDEENWARLAGNRKGMFEDSVQAWTKDDMTFSIGEFWVYALQMIPGRNDVASLDNDPVQLHECKERLAPGNEAQLLSMSKVHLRSRRT
jgi:hypothetical protein